MKIKSTVVCGVAVIALTALMAGCHRSPSSDQMGNSPASHVCSGNPYLMKYGCSLSRIQTAAENGSADAQYALGYLFYYGQGTTRDEPKSIEWFQRAAYASPQARYALYLIQQKRPPQPWIYQLKESKQPSIKTTKTYTDYAHNACVISVKCAK